jgi:hypothetical protein
MWEPRRLTNLWASTVRYRDSFIFLLYTRLHGIIAQKTRNLLPPSSGKWSQQAPPKRLHTTLHGVIIHMTRNLLPPSSWTWKQQVRSKPLYLLSTSGSTLSPSNLGAPAKWICVTVKLWSHIREAFVSYLGWNTEYYDWGSSRFPRPLKENSG